MASTLKGPMHYQLFLLSPYMFYLDQNNSIQSEGLIFLVPVFPLTLAELRLENNSLNDQEVTRLSGKTQELHRLQVLMLDDNCLSEPGAKSIVKSLLLALNTPR